jgi:hypothetical protein
MKDWKEDIAQSEKPLPRWISEGKQKGIHRSNSSAQENRKIAGQTTRMGPSFMKQPALAIAWNQIEYIKQIYTYGDTIL